MWHSLATWFDTEIWPNLVADAIYGTPAFLINHLLLRRHITRTAQASQDGTTETAR